MRDEHEEIGGVDVTALDSTGYPAYVGPRVRVETRGRCDMTPDDARLLAMQIIRLSYAAEAK